MKEKNIIRTPGHFGNHPPQKPDPQIKKLKDVMDDIILEDGVSEKVLECYIGEVLENASLADEEMIVSVLSQIEGIISSLRKKISQTLQSAATYNLKNPSADRMMVNLQSVLETPLGRKILADFAGFNDSILAVQKLKRKVKDLLVLMKQEG